MLARSKYPFEWRENVIGPDPKVQPVLGAKAKLVTFWKSLWERQLHKVYVTRESLLVLLVASPFRD